MLTCNQAPRGWKCTREPHHTGPCAALPTWWNIDGHIWMRARRRHG